MGRKKYTQEEALQLRSLIRDWKIDFESATTLDDWEARCLPSRHIFKQILEIKCVSFVDYPGEEHSDKEAAIQKKVLVRRIQANAARCRNEKDNEAGWVNNVANLVFEKLCGFEFRWPEDLVAAQRLLSDVRARKICQCSGARKAANVRIRPDSASIFSNKSDERVFHNSTGLRNVSLDQKYKRPDRVFGLSITRSFDQFRDRLAAYSPFSRKHTLFPFMVVEAKSEKSETGFHDIEQQTALSIRTCLKIQIDLEMQSNQILDPLVWFFGFRGDEWRLYIALPLHDRTKVIDCWHGCISNTDEALQLLIIVDWICFWARDVHRKGVLKCLAGLEARETTPAVTLHSIHGAATAGRNFTRSTSLVVMPSRPIDPTPENNRQNNANSSVREDREVTFGGDDVMQDVVVGYSSDHEGSRNDSTALRSARDVLFRWKCFAFPEDYFEMKRYLSTLATNECIEPVAEFFWETFADKSSTVRMSVKAISDLLRRPSEEESAEAGTMEPVSTFLACQRRLTETSWQVMCTYWCVTCSRRAALLLAQIAGIPDTEAYPLNFWRAHDCNCLISAVADFRGLDGKTSAATAISQEIYCVRSSSPEGDGCHAEWSKDNGEAVRARVAKLEALLLHVESAQQPSLPPATLRARGGATSLPRQLCGTDDLDMVPGVILKKPETWPATCPLWCFLAFERRAGQSVGEQITKALQREAIFAAGGLEEGDERSIREWALTMDDVMQSTDVTGQ